MEVEEIFGEFPELETGRLHLRKVTMDDAEAIYRYGSSENVARYVTWDAHRTLEDAKGFVRFAEGRYESGQIAPWGIVLKESGEFVGTIDFVAWNTESEVAEIGYVLAEEHWGKGIITEAAAEVVRFGFEQMKLGRIQARCFTENAGSARVMEKVGMRFEGVLRKSMKVKSRRWDVKMYAILKEDFEAMKAEKA